jgi:hypothetical protein
MLPEIVSHLLHGERPSHAPESMRLRELADMPPAQGGWILLGERPGEEIALGLVGKFWRPVIEYAQVSADRFSMSLGTPRPSTTSPFAPSRTAGRCSPGSCAPQPPTNTPAAGSVATGLSVSAPERTSSYTHCSRRCEIQRNACRAAPTAAAPNRRSLSHARARDATPKPSEPRSNTRPPTSTHPGHSKSSCAHSPPQVSPASPMPSAHSTSLASPIPQPPDETMNAQTCPQRTLADRPRGLRPPALSGLGSGDRFEAFGAAQGPSREGCSKRRNRANCRESALPSAVPGSHSSGAW